MTHSIIGNHWEKYFVKEVAPDTGKYVVTLGGWPLPKEHPEDEQQWTFVVEEDWIEVPYPPEAAWWLYTFSTQTYTPRDYPEDWNGLLASPAPQPPQEQ